MITPQDYLEFGAPIDLEHSDFDDVARRLGEPIADWLYTHNPPANVAIKIKDFNRDSMRITLELKPWFRAR